VKLDRTVNIGDFRKIAKRRLPTVAFDMIDGAAGDEITLRRNRDGFDRIAFKPRLLADVSKRTTSTTVFGRQITMPIMLAPTGAGRIAHRYAELAVARAATAAGTIYMQSTVTAFPLEEVTKAATGPLWYQLYLPHTPDETAAMLARVAAAGYAALAITVDTPIFGNRERDRYNRLSLPLRITPRLLYQGMSRPLWAAEFLRGNMSLNALRGRMDRNNRLSPTATQNAIIATQWPVTWDDIKRVRDLWKGPLLIKGVMRADECAQLVDNGVDGLIVSNHGGRQLDGVRGSIDVLPEVVAAVGDRAAVFLDGGVRRGEDALKAVALGATAVFVGRPYLFGLVAAGEAGVARVLEIFRGDIDRSMALLGVRNISELDKSFVTNV
jgi:isopentenyl diphosphate isomerase/L-lactate dehydrogenase-like FMN-dependent dehydrogenase